GRARAHHDDPRVRLPRPDPLRVPAPAELLAHGRVLGAPDRCDRHVAGHADVAADALPDVLEPALLDLAGQERIGDRRPGRPDQVEYAAPDLADHGVRRGEPADADHGLGGELLEPADELLLRGLGLEPGRARVVLPAAA